MAAGTLGGAAGVAGGAKAVGGAVAGAAGAGGAVAGASVVAASHAATSMGQFDEATVSIGASVMAFIMVCIAHIMSLRGDVSISAGLYGFSLLILVGAIVANKNNHDKFRDTVAVLTTALIMGTVKANPYYLLLMIAIVWVIYYFSDKEHFSETGTMLMMILFAFYLDIGLISSVASSIPYINNFFAGFEHLIFLTPWLGLVLVFFVLPASSGYVNVLKMLFIGWYCITLLGALITGAGLLGEFGANFQESVEMNLENKADVTDIVSSCPSDGILTLQCFREQLSSPGEGTIDACVQRKKEECIDRYACEQEGYMGEPAIKKCMDDKQVARSEQNGVQGETDMNADRFIYATLGIDNEQTEKTYLKGESDMILLSVPFTIDISNPLGETVTASMSCSFEKGSGRNKEVVSGVILHGQQTDAVHEVVTDRSEQMTRTCVPSQNLEGSWNMVVLLDLKNVVSYSYLNRMLVHRWDEEDETLTDAKSSIERVSVGANELARLNFAVGDPMEQVYIESEDFLTFQASVENVARGKVTHVTEFRVDSSDVIDYFQTGCTEKYDIIIPDLTSSVYTLSHCTAQVSAPFKSRLEMSSSMEPYIMYTFEGMMRFDYRLEDRKKIEYNAVEIVS